MMSLLAHYRPSGAGEILDVSARFYRAHGGVILGITTAVILPPAIVGAFVPTAITPVITLIGNLLLPVAQGAIALVVAAALEEGTNLSAREAFRRLGKHAGEVVGVSILSGLLIVIGLILLVIPGVLAIAWTAVSGPIVAIEHIAGSAALKRSRALARGRTGHVLGTVALSWVIAIALLFGASFAMGLLAGTAGLGSRTSDLIGELLFIPVFPLFAIPVTFLYYDLRVRNEGADIDAMVADLPPAPVPVPMLE